MSNQSLSSKISLPYAEALLDLSRKNSIHKEVISDVTMVNEFLDKSDNLTTFLSNPLVTSKVKQEVVKKLLSGQISDLVLTFLLLIIQRKRSEFIQLIFANYLELANKLDSILVVKVYSATTLTEEQTEALITKLQKMTNAKKITLDIAIDLSLIAGLKVQIGSKSIDASIKGQLQRITSFLDA